MSVHNHLLFISISCNMSLLSRCIIGHPNRVNLTSLSRGNQFHCSIKGAYNCIHPGIRPLFLSPRRLHLCAKKKKKEKEKKCFPPLRPSLPSVRRPSVRLWLSFAIRRISSPAIAENNKLFSIIAVNLIKCVFVSQSIKLPLRQVAN